MHSARENVEGTFPTQRKLQEEVELKSRKFLNEQGAGGNFNFQAFGATWKKVWRIGWEKETKDALSQVAWKMCCHLKEL